MSKRSSGSGLSDGLKACQKIVKSLIQAPDSAAFRDPVDWKAWGLFDYPTIVKHPMDLGTVQEKIKNGEYRTPDECAQDIRLIWENCKSYNADQSDMYLLGESFSKRFEDKFARIKREDGPTPQSAQLDREPTVEEKTRFGEQMYLISSADLGSLVQLLDSRCQNSVNKISSNELEVEIDKIDARTFHVASRMVRDRLPEEDEGGGGKKSGSRKSSKRARVE